MRCPVRRELATRISLLVPLGVTGPLTGASMALAQTADHCAPSPAEPVGALGVGIAVGMEHASYATERYAGNYTGLHLGLGYASPGPGRPLWGVSADVPVYQLVRNGQDEGGIGDPFVHARLRLWQSRERQLALGVGLGVSIPLGDAQADLGMGHFMVHPGMWLGVGSEKLRTEWTAAYGRVLGSAEHAHEVGPLVNPMNSSELSAGGALVWTPFVPLEVRMAAMGAVPVGVAGESRATASLGLAVRLGDVQVASSVALPLAGDPFEEKLEVSVRYAF